MCEVINGEKLKHKNAVLIYIFILLKIAWKLYQVMELCDESLKDWFERNVKNRVESQCMQTSQDFTLGLQYTHLIFIHRDLRPANILNCICKIEDFGLSIIHKQHYKSDCYYYSHTVAVGTPIYA